MKYKKFKNIILTTGILSLLAVPSVKFIENKYHDFIAKLILKKVKNNFANNNIYGTWIYYQPKEHKYHGGINIQTSETIKEFLFQANIDGKKINYSK